LPETGEVLQLSEGDTVAHQCRSFVL